MEGNSCFTLTTIYILGKENGAADAHSRTKLGVFFFSLGRVVDLHGSLVERLAKILDIKHLNEVVWSFINDQYVFKVYVAGQRLAECSLKGLKQNRQ